MKKLIAFAITVLMLIICTLALEISESGFFLLAGEFVRLMIVPMVHFAIICKCVKDDFANGKTPRKAVVSVTLFVLSAIFLAGVIIVDDRLIYSGNFTAFRLFWMLLIGAVMSSLTMISVLDAKKRAFRICVIAVSAVILLANALGAEYFVNLMSGVEPAEVPFLLSSLLLIGTMSYFVGKAIDEPRKKLKLGAWFACVAASELLALCMTATIVDLHQNLFGGLTIGLILAVAAFLPCFFGRVGASVSNVCRMSAKDLCSK